MANKLRHMLRRQHKRIRMRQEQHITRRKELGNVLHVNEVTEKSGTDHFHFSPFVLCDLRGHVAFSYAQITLKFANVEPLDWSEM